jgi:exo-1,4-beta-D-glucosaminidase
VFGQSIELGVDSKMISNDSISEGGEIISQISYDDSKWYTISKLPATVLAVLEENGIYTDLFFGKNMENVPELWKQDWWYRITFHAPEGKTQYWLNIRGINYRADIYLNGKQIGSKDEIVGSYRHFRLNITEWINPGENNAFAFKIIPEQNNNLELGTFWNDWINWINWIKRVVPDNGRSNPDFGKTPDHNAGIWQRIYLETSNDVQIRYPLANTDIPLPSTSSVDITVYCNLVNGSVNSVSGILHGTISRDGKTDINFQQDVTLLGKESKEVSFTPDSYSQLNDISNTDLWWPYTFGDPNLYQLKLVFKIAGETSDIQTINFGIREVEKGYDANNYQYLKINGEKFLVRGANYTPELFFRIDENYEKAIMDYVKDMGLNLIRWEAKMGSEHMYELADKEGIPIVLGWMCCEQWEDWENWDAEDHIIARECLRSQLLDIRHRPGVFMWLMGSDGTPPEDVLNDYKAIASEVHFQNPTADNAAGDGSDMYGPYSWQPPYFWFSDVSHCVKGYSWEQGSNEIAPPFETLKKYIPFNHLWPIDDFWVYHAGWWGGNATLNNDKRAIDHRYGISKNAEEFCKKAQVSYYENTRAHMEAWVARGWETNKGTVYWMLNSHWPSSFGHIIDFFLKPGGAYFGIKKALRPINVIFDYYGNKDRKRANIYVINQTLEAKKNLKVLVKYYNIDLTEKYSKQVTGISVDALARENVMHIGKLQDLSSTYFIRCWVMDAADKVLVENLYWLSTKNDIESKYGQIDSEFSQYADYNALNSLPDVKLDILSHTIVLNGEATTTVTLTNNTKTLAFFTRVEITKGLDGEEVLPTLYSDNYVTLFPSESIDITAKYKTSNLEEHYTFIRVEGYNVNKTILQCK